MEVPGLLSLPVFADTKYAEGGVSAATKAAQKSVRMSIFAKSVKMSDWRSTALIVAGTAVATAAISRLVDRLWGADAARPDDAETARLRELVEREVMRQFVGRATLDRSMAAAARSYPPVATPAVQKRVLVTGGAGFVGSHLVDVLMTQGHIVYVLDNLFTGHRRNIAHWEGAEASGASWPGPSQDCIQRGCFLGPNIPLLISPRPSLPLPLPSPVPAQATRTSPSSKRT